VSDSGFLTGLAPRVAESTAGSLWHTPPSDLELKSGEVHVWCAGLDVPRRSLSGLERLLSAEELGRAERFVSDRDRERWIVARARLRQILSRYLDLEASRICLSSTRNLNRGSESGHRKPYLVSKSGNDDALRFNLSHSHDLALYALTTRREIGIDVERVLWHPAYEVVASYVFSERDAAMFRSLPMRRRERSFFTLWTRREAYMKARGEGLVLSLQRSSVPSLAAARDSTASDRVALPWSFYDLTPRPDFAGAVVIEGDVTEFYFLRWPD
jgi:4'-phosphopantetheinyl transferase